MNNSPDISVVIPVYNTGKILQETINSVLNQTFKNFELLLINDGSNDFETLEVINSQTDDRIKIINQINSGVAASRNRGIDEAKGKYIAFLDHDDLFLPDKLTVLKAIMDQDSEIIMAYSSIIPFGDLSKPIFDLPPIHNLNVVQLIYKNHIYSMSCIMVRKDLIKKYQICCDKICVPCDDWDFHLQCAMHGKIECSETPLIKYRLHQNNQSNDLFKMVFAGNIVSQKILKNIPHIAQVSGFSEKLLRKNAFHAMANHYYVLAYQYLIINRDYFTGIYYIIKTIRCEPFAFRLTKSIIKKIKAKLIKRSI